MPAVDERSAGLTPARRVALQVLAPRFLATMRPSDSEAPLRPQRLFALFLRSASQPYTGALGCPAVGRGLHCIALESANQLEDFVDCYLEV